MNNNNVNRYAFNGLAVTFMSRFDPDCVSRMTISVRAASVEYDGRWCQMSTQ